MNPQQATPYTQLPVASAPADVEGAAGAEKPVSAGDLLRNKGALIGCALFSFQQFSGINAIVYFSSAVFAQACSLGTCAGIISCTSRSVLYHG